MAVAHTIKWLTLSKVALVVGTIPPPVHGAALVTKAAIDRIQASGIFSRVVVCDTSVPRGASKWPPIAFHLRRTRAHVLAARLIWRARKSETAFIYFTFPAGFAQLYVLGLVLLCIVRRTPVVFHHHSFYYVDRRSALVHLIELSARLCPSHYHIVICDCMRERLRDRYRIAANEVIICSNAAFLEMTPDFDQALDRFATTNSQPQLQIGFIGNLTPEKGVYDAIRLGNALRGMDNVLPLLVAGPAMTFKVELDLLAAHDAGDLKYMGPVYGLNKEAFFRSLDVLIMPTRYNVEAEPLVILEALRAGLYIVAYDRGCIRELVGVAGMIAAPDQLLQSVTRLVADAEIDRHAWTKVSKARYRDLRRESEANFDALLSELGAA